MTNLTAMEKEFLNGMRTNNYKDIYIESIDEGFPECECWFAVSETLSYSANQAKGVTSSLVKKGLVIAFDNDGKFCIRFTAKGLKVFDDADGDFPSWDKDHKYKPLFKLEA